MSIIQDALRKAQGDFAVKKAPQEKSHNAQGGLIKEDRKSPSMRLPALVSIFTVLLLAYGFRASLQYTKKHVNVPVPPKNTGEPVTSKRSEADYSPAGIFGQTNKLDPINFIGPRQSLFALNGIMYVEGRPQAIINGQVLEEGDKISGATVLVIEKDCVLLDLNNTNIRIELNKQG